MVGRTSKSPTRHEVDRLIVGNQMLIMGALAGMVATTPSKRLDARIEEVRTWWRSHHGEELTILPPLKEED